MRVWLYGRALLAFEYIRLFCSVMSTVTVVLTPSTGGVTGSLFDKRKQIHEAFSLPIRRGAKRTEAL